MVILNSLDFTVEQPPSLALTCNNGQNFCLQLIHHFLSSSFFKRTLQWANIKNWGCGSGQGRPLPAPFDSPHLLLSSGSFNMALLRANCALKENACTAGYPQQGSWQCFVDVTGFEYFSDRLVISLPLKYREVLRERTSANVPSHPMISADEAFQQLDQTKIKLLNPSIPCTVLFHYNGTHGCWKQDNKEALSLKFHCSTNHNIYKKTATVFVLFLFFFFQDSPCVFPWRHRNISM